MRTKQKPTAAAGGVGSQSARQPRSSRGEDDLARLWQRRDAAQPTQCERERKHQAARKEREAQTQAQLRRKPTTTPTPTPTPASAHPSTWLPAATPRIASQRDRARQQQQRQHQSKPSASAGAAPAAAAVPVSASSDSFDEAAQLKLQLEHLTQLSELDFEREFRKWLSQEGVEGKIQEHLRMDLMQSFHKTALGKYTCWIPPAPGSALSTPCFVLGQVSCCAKHRSRQRHRHRRHQRHSRATVCCCRP